VELVAGIPDPGAGRTDARVTAIPADPALGLVVNPRARTVKRRHLDRESFWAPLLPPHAVRITRNPEELDQAIGEFRDRKVEVIAALGGDGTLHHVLGSMVRQYGPGPLPVVLALAGGTMNGLARALGSAGRPDRVLAASIALLGSARLPVREYDLLRVEDSSRGTLHGFSFATGLVCRAFEVYYRSPEPGMRDAIAASLLPVRAALFGGSFYDPLTLDVTADGVPWMSPAPHTLLTSVLERPLLWFRPFGIVTDHAPALNVAASAMRPREIATRLWSIFRGQCRHPAHRIGRSVGLTIRAECGYLIDGDLYGPGPIDVTVTPGPRVRFLQPGT
jgi:hypothetical protein